MVETKLINFSSIWVSGFFPNMCVLLCAFYTILIGCFLQYFHLHLSQSTAVTITVDVLVLGSFLRVYALLAAIYLKGMKFIDSVLPDSKHQKHPNPELSPSIVVKGVKGCWSRLYHSYRKFYKKYYGRFFSATFAGTYFIGKTVFLKISEVLPQCIALNDIIAELTYGALIIYTSVLSLDCFFFGLIMLRNKTFAPEMLMIIDSLFEMAYVVLNIAFRWGKTDTLDIIIFLAIVYPLLLTSHKLVSCVRTIIYKSSSHFVLQTCGLDAKNMIQINTKELLRNRNLSLVKSKNINADMITSKTANICRRLIGYGLILLGVGISSSVMIRLVTQDSFCENIYGTCFWNGVEPKIYFPSGLLGKLDCSETSMERIIVKDCNNLYRFPSPFEDIISLNIITTSNTSNDAGGRKSFSRLNYVDISNTNISSIPAWLLEIDTLIIAGTPLSKHPVLIGSNISSLHSNYSNAFGNTATSIDLSGHSFTSFDFGNLESKFPNLKSIDFKYNNLSEFVNLDRFLASQKQLLGDSFEGKLNIDINLSHNSIELTTINNNYDYNNIGNPIIESEQEEVKGAKVLQELLKINIHKQLSKLDISSNMIKEIPASFSRKFGSSESFIAPDGSPVVSNVEEFELIDLRDNPIYEILFSGIECSLMLPVLDDNIVRYLPLWIGQMNHLQKLSITSCAISKIDVLHEKKDMLSKTLKALDLADNKLDFSSAFNDKMFSDFALLETLNLSGNSLKSFTTDIFGTMNNLSELHLGFNDIKDLEEGILKNFPALKYLDLRLNSIDNLLQREFSRNALSLEYLDLSLNVIEDLPSGVFNNLPNLKFLNLGENVIRELSTDLFKEVLGLEHLDLRYNNIDRLPARVFDNLSALKILDLSNNRMSQPPPGDIFKDLVSLEELRLEQTSILPTNGIFNSFASIRHDDDLQVSRLKRLYLWQNYINELHVEEFRSLTSLEELIVSMNNIAELPTGLFSGMVFLKHLDVSNNEIKSLSTNLFSDLISLRSLDLSYNFELDALPNGIFDNCALLEKLYLTNNDIETLSSTTFKKLINLRELYINFNRLKELPMLEASAGISSSIEEEWVKSLVVLNLVSNQITNLPSNVLFSRATNLESLRLNINSIEAISDGIFDNLVSLKILQLNDNNIHNLPPKCFSRLESLEYLYLDDNFVEELDESLFDNLKSLELLTMNGNRINNLKGQIFKGLSFLKKLYLKKNLIEDLDTRAFYGLTQLQLLDISGNINIDLTSLKSSFIDLPLLESIRFSTQTSKELVDKNLFEALGSLSHLEISDDSTVSCSHFILVDCYCVEFYDMW